MNENPFQAPRAVEPPVKGRNRSREELLSLAKAQKGIMICILLYLISVFTQFAIPENLRLILGLGVLVVGIVGAVFVFQLAIKLFGTGIGVLLGILTLMPCLGLIILLVVNGKATNVLKDNGIHVGLLGANLSSI